MVLGLFIVTPLFYFFRDKGIVPAIIIAAGINFFLSWFYVKKQRIPKIKLRFRESLYEGKAMIKLGIVLSFSGLLSALTAYLLQIFITKLDGVEQVGLYAAGFLIISRYGNLVFSAMEKDYYPRLSGIVNHHGKVRELVKNQAYVAILLMTPVVAAFIAFAPQLIQLLFSAEFKDIVLIISWGLIGLLFKGISWLMGYVIIAKGESGLYTKTSIGFSILQLGINVLGYYLGGLTGLGLSFLVYYGIHFLGVFFIVNRRYDFFFPVNFYFIFAACVALAGLCLGLTFLTNPWVHYPALAVGVILSGLFSYYYLNKKVKFVELLRDFLHKNKNNKKD